MITHGGAGSALGALSFGLPLLVVPQSADQFYNATLIAAAGAGEWLAPADLSVDAVRAALRRILDEPAHRNAALQIKSEFDAMPQPAAVRPRLLDLADAALISGARQDGWVPVVTRRADLSSRRRQDDPSALVFCVRSVVR